MKIIPSIASASQLDLKCQLDRIRDVPYIHIDVEDGNQYVLINPEILETAGSQTGPEGCLSVPGKSGTVTRPDYVKVKALNEKMEEFVLEGEGLLARAICHECDHLYGVLYVDKVEGELEDVNADFEEE